MHCRNCQHVLWNAPAPQPGAPRVCPECGTGYSVADYEFAPGKVEFHCPHCDQAYFGTSSKGHLEPTEFQCTACGGEVSMERCVLRPHGSVDSTQAMLEQPLPWLEGGSIFVRWWNMIGVGLKKSARVPAMIGNRDLFSESLGFLAFNTAISNIVTVMFGVGALVLAGVIAGGVGTGFTFGPGGWATTPGSTPLAIGLQLANFILIPVMMIAVSMLGALFASFAGAPHGLTFRRAFTIVSFASGGYALNLIPFCGGLLGLIFWAVGASTAIAAALPRGQATGPVILGLVGAMIGFVSTSAVAVALSFLLNM